MYEALPRKIIVYFTVAFIQLVILPQPIFLNTMLEDGMVYINLCSRYFNSFLNFRGA